MGKKLFFLLVAACANCGSLAIGQDITTGLVGHWELNETSGTTATDSSGSGNNGTYNGTVTQGVTAVFDTGITVPSSTGQVAIADHSSLDINTAITVSAWIRINSFNSRYEAILAKGDFTYRLARYEYSSTISWAINRAPNLIQAIGSTPVDDGKWHHVVGRYDGVTAELYVDGKLDAAVAATAPIDTDNRPLWIGNNPQFSDRHWTGDLDEVRLYNRALSDFEIDVLYGLVGHWKLDETSGTLAADASGYSHDGTYVSSPTLGVSAIRKTGVEFSDAAGNDRLELPNTVLDGKASTTIAWWMKTTKTGESVILSAANSTTDNAVVLQFNNSTTFSALIDNNNLSMAIETVADNYWKHYAFTHDRSTGAAGLFINGESAGTLSFSSMSGGYDVDSGGLIVGEEQDSVGGAFDSLQSLDGELDDLQIYSRVLTQAEIAELYGLVGHWKLDETSGTVATDSSAISNDATYYNGAAPGANGPYPGSGASAADFDGADDAVSAPANSVYDSITDYVSLAAWVRYDQSIADQTQQHYVISNSEHSSSTGYLLLTDQPFTNSLIFRIYDGSTYHDATWTSPDIEADKWYHLVGTYDGTNIELYVNGVLVATTAFTGPISPRTGGTMDAAWQHDGRLHDLRLYNRALLGKEIAELYGLVGHWKLDETAGTIAADSTAFANNGALNGAATWTSASGDNAIDLDGVDSYVDLGNPSHLNFSGEIAISAWTKARSYSYGTGGTNNIAAHGQQSSPDRETVLRCSSSGNYAVGSWSPSEFSGTPIPDFDQDSWVHLVGVYDGANWLIYRNGNLENSVAGSNGAQQVDNVNWAIGASGSGSNRFFDGEIRDVRIYNRPVSVAEVNSLYGRIAHWKLDETSGSVAVDATEHGHDGLLSGNATWTTAGNVNNALDLEESDGADRIDVDSFNVDGDALTLMAWVRAEDTNLLDGRVIVKSVGNTGPDQSWGLTVTDGFEPDFRLQAGGTYRILDFDGGVSPGKWYHLTGTYDGITMRLYVNGNEVNSLTHPAGGAITEDSSAPVTLGDSPIGSRAFDGRLDDIQVFERALKPEEIFGVYKSGRPAGVRILKWVEIR